MRKRLMTSLVILPFLVSAASPLSAIAVDYSTDGVVTFEAGDEITLPVDPENPDPTKPVVPKDPPTDKGTGGAVSIDYGSKLKFGKQKISTLDKVYYAFSDEVDVDSKKPTYVQVTDKSGTLNGWTLKLSQPSQFKTVNDEELVGAEIKFSKAEVASLVSDKYKPEMVSQEITLVPEQTGMPLVAAKKGQGVGTWVYRFGKTAKDNEKAISLSVPGKSVKLAKEYKTKLVWSLENTPQN